VRPSFVVDPGVFVAAMISPNGSPRRLFQAALSGRFTLVVSPRLIAELKTCCTETSSALGSLSGPRTR
jgi:predicted nucleic acid-binding protein